MEIIKNYTTSENWFKYLKANFNVDTTPVVYKNCRSYEVHHGLTMVGIFMMSDKKTCLSLTSGKQICINGNIIMHDVSKEMLKDLLP